jgi:hypothetical protein
MLGLDCTNYSSLLDSLAFGGFAVGEPSSRAALGENPPVATGCLDQQKLNRGTALSIATTATWSGRNRAEPILYCALENVRVNVSEGPTS